MKKRIKLNKHHRIVIQTDDYDDTLILSLFIIIFNLIISILMYMD